MTTNMRIGLGVVVALLLAALGLEASHSSRLKSERRVNDERTRRAVAQVLDSIRTEHAVIIAKQDTLIRLMRSFVWIIALGVIYV